MSVLKPKRNESSIEYIRLANDLFSWSVNFVSRLSARYSRLLSERTINLASEVLECCVKANSTYPSCYEYAKMREFYLIKALGSLDALDVMFKNTFGFEYNDLSTFRRRISIMYKLFSDGNFLGYAEELNYIKKSSNGCFVPTKKDDAQGVAFKSVAYSFDAGKLNGCPKIVISEAGIDEINERITAARADLDYVMMMTDTAIPVDETVIKEVSE